MSDINASEIPLETVRVREVVGVVEGSSRLERLVDRLLTAGFDRADIDMLAGRDAVLRKLKTIYFDPAEVADRLNLPRRELRTRDDALTSTALVFGTLMGIGTIGAAVPVVASGGALALAAAAAATGGAVSAAIATAIRNRVIHAEDEIDLEEEVAHGGLVLFVRVRDAEREDAALGILRQEGARSVHVHEVEIAKHLDDIPFSQITPDPWLGDEKLGG